MKRSELLARWLGAGLGVIGGFTLGYFMVRGVGHSYPGYVVIGLTTLEGLIFAYLGTPYVLGGWRTFNFRLTSTPLPDLLSGLLGMVVGLVIAVLIGFFVRDLPYGYALSFVLALLLAAQGASVGLTRRTELASLFFGGDRGTDSHRLSAVLLDTSVIIDGRIVEVCQTGFLAGPLLVPQFVLRELQQIADSADALKRNRGKRGFDVLQRLQRVPRVTIRIDEVDFPHAREVDRKLIELARATGGKIVTNDYNLNRVAELSGVAVLNINELANALKPVVLPGEPLHVHIVKEGKEANQGVAYLDDGTMVVVEHGKRLIGQTIDVTVTTIYQTAAGRMIFARQRDEESAPR